MRIQTFPPPRLWCWECAPNSYRKMYWAGFPCRPAAWRLPSESAARSGHSGVPATFRRPTADLFLRYHPSTHTPQVSPFLLEDHGFLPSGTYWHYTPKCDIAIRGPVSILFPSPLNHVPCSSRNHLLGAPAATAFVRSLPSPITPLSSFGSRLQETLLSPVSYRKMLICSNLRGCPIQ